MATQIPDPPAAAPAPSARWWSSSRSQDALLVVLLLLIEVLPIEAWQFVSAGFVSDVSRLAVPFWLLCAAILLPWIIGRRVGTRDTRRLMSVSAPLFLLLFATMVRLSPGAYGTVAGGVFDVGWLGAFAGDVSSGTGHSGADILLGLLLVYLWWRGLTIGNERVTEPDDLVKRFVYGFAVVIAAIIGALPIAAHSQHAVYGALALLLPLYVFVGLVATALARVAFTRRTRGGEGDLPGADGQWLRAALVLSTAIIGFALIVSIIVNLDALRALLTHVGPVNATLTWLSSLGHHTGGPVITGSNPSEEQAACLHGQKLLCGRPAPAAGAGNPLVSQIAHIAVEALVLLAVALAFTYLVRFALRAVIASQHTRSADVEGDVRESLDGRRLLAAQLRSLFRRSGGQAAATADTMPHHSVRRLYRDMLLAASLRGFYRAPNETPDEYAARLAASEPLASSSEASRSLGTLSDAYDAARYAEREPEMSTYERLRQRTAQLIRLFTGAAT